MMHSEEAIGPKPPQPRHDSGAPPSPPGPPAPASAGRRLRHDAGVFVLMLAAGSAAVAVEVNLYSALESKLHLCVPR